jgi:N-methylhydantoinase A/oxoprolinase/acetone carboxylase beta subunit
METAIYDRDALPEGATVRGPAVLKESIGTTVLDPGWVLLNPQP